MIKSHNYNGFWFHIKWDGNEGVDQHGRKWVNPDNPQTKVSEVKAIIDLTRDFLKRDLGNSFNQLKTSL